MIKIGLEYEGVITKDNKIVRFSSLPKETQVNIEGRYPQPHDNYDCLAECRTTPFNELSTRDIAYKLFQEVVQINRLYKKEGLIIKWEEQKIPKSIHNSIKQDVKFKKVINTIDKGLVKEWVNNSEDSYRGGGIHLNISEIPKELELGLIIDLYREWATYHSKHWKSFYRNNLLFRFKSKNNDGFNGIELICLGFEIKNDIKSFDEFFNLTKHFFHLFDPIVHILKKYDRITNKIKA